MEGNWTSGKFYGCQLLAFLSADPELAHLPGVADFKETGASIED